MVEQSVDDERVWWDGLRGDDVEANIADTALDLGACVRECIRSLHNGAGFGRGDRLLDLGVGIGRLAIPVADAYPLATVWGVDISDRMARRVRRDSHGRVWAMAGDGRTLPFVDAFLDAGWSMLLFQHLPPDGVHSYLGEIARTFRSGGRFRFQYVESEDAAIQATAPLSWKYSRDEMLERVGQAGLVVEQIDERRLGEEWTWITAVRP